jgi:thiamine biosynthesis lipoprotein
MTVVRHAEQVMGTVFSFDLHDPNIADGALAAAVAWLHWVDATFSTYRYDSDISRLGRGELRIEDCAPEVATVLDLCAEATRRTDGYFTATPGGRLDPPGLVKGWAVEEASRQLTDAGSRRHSVGGGGDVRVVGAADDERPWRIGVSDPHRPGSLATIVSLTDAAVATSGTSERGAHVLNPLTGLPATELASVTVVGPSLTWADSYATAALARGAGAREWLATLTDYEAIVIDPLGTAWWTPGFPAFGVVPHSAFSGNGQPFVSYLTEG